MLLLLCDWCDCLLVETGSPELPQCGHCPHAGMGRRVGACPLEEQLRGVLRERRSGASWQERSLLPTCACSNCGQDCQSTPHSATRDCTREFNAGVAIVYLSTKLQIACHSFFD